MGTDQMEALIYATVVVAVAVDLDFAVVTVDTVASVACLKQK